MAVEPKFFTPALPNAVCAKITKAGLLTEVDAVCDCCGEHMAMGACGSLLGAFSIAICTCCSVMDYDHPVAVLELYEDFGSGVSKYVKWLHDVLTGAKAPDPFPWSDEATRREYMG